MGNMGYCRFRNTLPDLRDCYENMEDEDMSDEEAEARDRLVKLCVIITHQYGGTKLNPSKGHSKEGGRQDE